MDGIPELINVQLRELCGVRAGDKGDTADVTLFADSRQVFDFLVDEVSARRVEAHYRRLVTGPVERYLAPNVLAVKFVLHGALGGGGPLSLRSDNLGKTLGAALLRYRVDVPLALASSSPRFGRRAPLAQGWPIGTPTPHLGT
ncbi:AtuA-related protein [Actinophytocola sp.]|uniref:AtuA-related protein n=1 Tax=Actinophytocola sp. TaxID=1872138 RepID=UPI003D6A7688